VSPDDSGRSTAGTDATGADRRVRGGIEVLFRDRRRNTVLFWLTVAVLVVFAAAELAVGDLLSAAFAAGVAALAVVVPVTYRSVTVTLPWEIVVLASVPTVGRGLVSGSGAVVITYLAVAAVALMIAVELHAFADGVSMSYGFATVFIVVTTLAAAGLWAIARWLGGLYLGTPPLTDETRLMWEFVGSTVAGGLAGLVLRSYFDRQAYADRLPEVTRRHAERRRAAAGGTRPDEEERDERGRQNPPARWSRGRLRDRIGISEGGQVAAARLMEYVLVGLLFVGLERGELGIVVNAGVALAIVQLPPILERNHEIPMDPGVTLWITAAAFLHALGTVGLPGTDATFYRTVWWWDHLTHALSASVVAAVGYATVRALDGHSDSVSLPPRFVFVFILSFVLAFGVLWEVLEFALGGLGEVIGGRVLTQYGLKDTMLDLLFNLGGGVVAATWGTVHLVDVVGALTDRLERRADRRIRR